MPGMKLHFLKNPVQRVATGKSLPLKQVEAIVLYGRPEQRAKVVQKLIPSVYGLSLNQTTHHVLLSLIDQCDNLVRVEILYAVRRKLLDLSSSPVGNVVLQRLIEKVPVKQKKEIAEAFVLNVDPDEFLRLCEHPFGNHVAQKLMEFPVCLEVVKAHFEPHLTTLATHPFGMRVVSKYIAHAENGWRKTLHALIGAKCPPLQEEDVEDADLFAQKEVSELVDAALLKVFQAQDESMILAALLRHIQVPAPVKDAICAHLCACAADYLAPTATTAAPSSPEKDEFALPDFGTSSSPAARASKGAATKGEATPRHVFAYCALLEHGDESQRRFLWAELSAATGVVEAITTRRAAIQVAISAITFHEPSRKEVLRALISGEASAIAAVALDPVKTLLLRAFVEMDLPAIGEKYIKHLMTNAVELSKSPVASPVLQGLLAADPSGKHAAAMLKVLKPHVEELVQHTSGSYVLQALLQSAQGATRAELATSLLKIVMEDIHTTLAYTQGSRVVQKLLVHLSDEQLTGVVDALIQEAEKAEEEDAEADEEEEAEEEEEETTQLSRKEQRAANKARHYPIRSHAISSYALHGHSCYAIQTLLLECARRNMERERKLLVNELKPSVFDLAVSPWAGRVVLEAMMRVGSNQLADAMKNVVYLKAEAWLSDISEERKRKGNGVDPTVRNLLKRQRENIKEGKPANEGEEAADSSASQPKKKKKIFRSMKK